MANIKRRGNSYSIRVSAGHDTTGKQIVKSMTWKIPTGMSDKKAEKEANRVAALFEEKVRTGQIADEKAVKLAINGLYEGDFKLIELDGTEKFLGKGTEEAEEETETEAAE
jgi:hypothetical protein